MEYWELRVSDPLETTVEDDMDQETSSCEQQQPVAAVGDNSNKIIGENRAFHESMEISSLKSLIL